MTETTIVSNSHAHSGRLARTRLATRAAMVVERLLAAAPAGSAGRQRCSSACPGSALFRLLPDMAAAWRLPAASRSAALAALYPLRFFRRPTPVEIDRRIERANRLEHNAGAGADRPAERAATSVFADALWREHQKRMAEQLAAVGGDLPHTRVPERDPWALRAAVALLFVVAFAFSFGPLGGSVADAFRAAIGDRRHPAAHRRLGDAAGLYRQGADLPHLRRQPGDAGLHRAGGQRRRAARDRRLRRGDAELQPTRPATSATSPPSAPADPAKPAATALQSARRGSSPAS